MLLSRILAIVFLAVFTSGGLLAQTYALTGRVVAESTQSPIEAVAVNVAETGQTVFSTADGRFALQVAAGQYTLKFFGPVEGKQQIVSVAGDTDLGNLEMQLLSNISQTIPVIITDDSEDEEFLAQQQSSGVLSASSDVFAWVANFPFQAGRYRVRGYDSENELSYLNGVPINDLESGFGSFGTWGGLNDVTRNRTSRIGLAPVSFSIGGLAGASNIDTRASNMRKGTRISTALSNRTYRHRNMITHSTGMMDNGWAFTLSGSVRWAEEGFIEGTNYEGYSYFASIDKKLSDKHLLNLTVLGAPLKRGGTTPVTKEMMDIAGSHYYNPAWGYQNGRVRNSRISTFHQPIGILRHDWQMTDKTRLTTAASYQTGRNGRTALDWYAASDPRPDYYRKWPSYYQLTQTDAEATAEELEALLRADKTLRQIDWDHMYEVNRNSLETIDNVGGIAGNTFTGNRAKYILEERRYDSDEANFQTNLESVLTDNLTLQGGLTYQYFHGKNFKVVDDLLGADFYVDIDRFAEQDNSDFNYIQNDLNHPNRILKEGDKFGYNYESNIHKGGAWAQGVLNLPHFDLFLAGEASQTMFWRTGNYRNGRFPDSSFGDSEKQQFFNYGGKAGITYKLDGRNALYANGAYLTRAPDFRNSYIAPRVRDQLVPDLKSEEILSVEGGYQLLAPYTKMRLTGYFTTFKNRFTNRSFFLDTTNPETGDVTGFVNYVMRGINTQYSGLEFAAETKIYGGLKASGAVAYAKNIYTNRPSADIFLDSSPETVSQNHTVYLKNYHVTGSPELASTFGLRYDAPNFWSVSVNVNYFDGIWMDIFPERHTTEFLTSINQSPANYEDLLQPLDKILEQEQAPSAFTVDVFARKSWRIYRRYYLAINAGFNNVLNNKNFITGGFEQYRSRIQNDEFVDLFARKYFYGFGTNYFIGATLSF
jgi:hypothetical protein